MLPVGYIVDVTNVEIIHIGHFISNLYLSVGDTQDSSPQITVTGRSVCFKKQTDYLFCSCYVYTLNSFPQNATINFGQNITNTHDNVLNSEDVIIIFIEAYVSSSVTQSLNQVIHNNKLLSNVMTLTCVVLVQTLTFKGEIVEFPLMENMIQFVIVHPQLQVESSQTSMCHQHSIQLYHANCIVNTQLNTLVVEPSYLLDGGDIINISITFNHSMVIHILIIL